MPRAERDTQLLEMIVRQVAQDGAVDLVLHEQIDEALQAVLGQPARYVSHVALVRSGCNRGKTVRRLPDFEVPACRWPAIRSVTRGGSAPRW